MLARISHHLTTEAHERPASTSLRLLAVLNAGSSTPALVKWRAPPADAPLTHFASPRGEKSGLGTVIGSGVPRLDPGRQRAGVRIEGDRFRSVSVRKILCTSLAFRLQGDLSILRPGDLLTLRRETGGPVLTRSANLPRIK